MSDYIDETPLTDEEIAAAIAAAKKAKAERARAQKAAAAQEQPAETAENGDDGESSDSLFDEIDSAAESDKELSPKMKSAKSFSNAFAAARSRREEELRRKQAEREEKLQEEQAPADFAEEQDDLTAAQEFDVDSEDVEFAPADDTQQFDGYEQNEYSEEDTADEFAVDEEDEYYTADGEEPEQVEFDGIFSADDEESSQIGSRVPVDEIEDNEEYDEDEDEEDSTVSTRTKVIIGIIIAVLVLAIIGVGAYFALNSGNKESDTDSDVASSASDVKSLSFSEASISLRVGETAPLNIIVEPENAKDRVLKLKSNDTSIATVDSTGLVTGVSSGSTTITATLKSNETITASIVINVIDENQNAINIYNKFITSILDGSTDIDSDAETDSEEVTDTEESSDSDSDSDTEAEKPVTNSSTLTGSIIRDLNNDGSLELALYFMDDEVGSEVRIFYLAEEGEEDSDSEEPQYDEYGNLIESSDEESDTDTASDSDTNKPVKDKVLTELDVYSEMYSVCYGAIAQDESSWDTVYLEIKEGETAKTRVTILSEDYKSPTFVYETSDKEIATVDNQGNVKALKPGECTVTVTSPLNSDAMATVKIKVKDDTDLLDDYLKQIPVVNQTNDSVIPTETLIGKKITDIDGDGVSELLLKFSYGNDVETINIVKIINEQCVVYKTYNNLSDLYSYYEGEGSYANSILVHYTTGKVCLEYRAVTAKEGSKTKTSEQKILSLEENGRLSELVKFSTTTDISTKTVTSEVVIDDPSYDDSDDYTSSDDDWYGNDSSDDYYDDTDDTDDYYYDDSDDDYGNDDYQGSYAQYVARNFENVNSQVEADSDMAKTNGIDMSVKKLAKILPHPAAAPEDENQDDYDEDNPYENDSQPDEDVSRITSTVTSEVTEETTKYFVNGTAVEQSVYEETLSTYSSRYAVWSDWDPVS